MNSSIMVRGADVRDVHERMRASGFEPDADPMPYDPEIQTESPNSLGFLFEESMSHNFYEIKGPSSILAEVMWQLVGSYIGLLSQWQRPERRSLSKLQFVLGTIDHYSRESERMDAVNQIELDPPTS